MTHPLEVSRAGAVMYGELPEVMRLYDNRSFDPATGRLTRKGDLEALLYGFGHLLDRFEATLAQFHADGFLEPSTINGDEASMQGWLLPYVANLFGVDLLAPDPAARRRELARSIWIARRRGTLAAIDAAAEAVLDLPVVVVDGASRIVRAPSLKTPLMTHREIAGQWHAADAVILLEPIPPFAPATHLGGFRANRPARHAGLPVGAPDMTRRMRALGGGASRADAGARPQAGAGGVTALASYFIADRRGVPCFPGSFEDVSLRTPDMRSARANRRRGPEQLRPDSTTLFVRPPQGMFQEGMLLHIRRPVIVDGNVARPPFAPAETPIANIRFTAAGDVELNAANSSSGRCRIADLRFDGALVIGGDVDVELVNCAIGSIRFAGAPVRGFRARGCLFGAIDSRNAVGPADRIWLTLEYVTVTGPAQFGRIHASDCLFSRSLSVIAPASGSAGCLRHSRLPAGFAGPATLRLQRCSAGPALFVAVPCLPDPAAPAASPRLTTRPAAFGEPGYGVLSDLNAPQVATGAEDGGEVGAYHDAHHLARLTAAALKANRFAPSGRRIFARYDNRLLAALPN